MAKLCREDIRNVCFEILYSSDYEEVGLQGYNAASEMFQFMHFRITRLFTEKNVLRN
jgi:hypothetical protein